MIELAFVACLTFNPTACRNEALLYADITMMTCLVSGQTELAAWQNQHPDWQITKWSCRVHDPASAEA